MNDCPTYHKFSAPTLYDSARWKGMRIGLLGGSFNPVHDGHLHIARLAQVKFGLDFVWWLVTPQNPLKKSSDMMAYETRFEGVAEKLSRHPYQISTHLESILGSRYSFETILSLKHVYSQTDFIWICGMDNARLFHKWDHWRDITRLMPLTFIARPPAELLVQGCPVRAVRDIPHHFDTKGTRTDLSKPGIYWLSGSKMINISSTEIRRKSNIISGLGKE